MQVHCRQRCTRLPRTRWRLCSTPRRPAQRPRPAPVAAAPRGWTPPGRASATGCSVGSRPPRRPGCCSCWSPRRSANSRSLQVRSMLVVLRLALHENPRVGCARRAAARKIRVCIYPRRQRPGRGGTAATAARPGPRHPGHRLPAAAGAPAALCAVQRARGLRHRHQVTTTMPAWQHSQMRCDLGQRLMCCVCDSSEREHILLCSRYLCHHLHGWSGTIALLPAA
jgi:hypothetical protein